MPVLMSVIEILLWQSGSSTMSRPGSSCVVRWWQFVRNKCTLKRTFSACSMLDYSRPSGKLPCHSFPSRFRWRWQIQVGPQLQPQRLLRGYFLRTCCCIYDQARRSSSHRGGNPSRISRLTCILTVAVAFPADLLSRPQHPNFRRLTAAPRSVYEFISCEATGTVCVWVLFVSDGIYTRWLLAAISHACICIMLCDGTLQFPGAWFFLCVARWRCALWFQLSRDIYLHH